MKELIDILKNGKVAIIPTDTTYGIVCDATNDKAVKKVFKTKQRDFSKAVPILVSDRKMLEKYTSEINEMENKILEKFTPGKLSILFKKNNLISKYVSPNNYVAIRIPDNEELRKIIKLVDKPLVATSANISGSDVITNVKDIEKDLLNYIDYIYDGGIINSLPSTLIKIENNKIIFLREGIITNKIKEEFKDYIAD